MTVSLDERINGLENLDSERQVALGRSIISESANGEAPHVFSRITPRAASRLSREYDPVQGLMTSEYFQCSVDNKLLVADLEFDNAQKLTQWTYVLFAGVDVPTVKAFLKSEGKTGLVGMVDGKVAALLPSSLGATELLLKDFAYTFGSAQYAYGRRAETLHDTAKANLLDSKDDVIAALRFKVAQAIVSGGNIDSAIAGYLSVKTEYKK